VSLPARRVSRTRSAPGRGEGEERTEGRGERAVAMLELEGEVCRRTEVRKEGARDNNDKGERRARLSPRKT